MESGNPLSGSILFFCGHRAAEAAPLPPQQAGASSALQAAIDAAYQRWRESGNTAHTLRLLLRKAESAEAIVRLTRAVQHAEERCNRRQAKWDLALIQAQAERDAQRAVEAAARDGVTLPKRIARLRKPSGWGAPAPPPLPWPTLDDAGPVDLTGVWRSLRGRHRRLTQRSTS